MPTKPARKTAKTKLQSWKTVVLALKGLRSERVDGTGPGIGPSAPLAVLQSSGWRVIQIVSVQGAPDGITGYVFLAAP